ncbi:DUF3828 domain-containing protein [Puia sp. P3]|uniref:DUF3828 domain-containing protein n=1 Tax=Puia sp. P3 TaxID=3423952 RepID=UPI003D66F7E1
MAFNAKLPVILCALFGILLCGQVKGQDSTADKKEVFAQLKTFYTSYILAFNDLPHSAKKLDAIMKKYCDSQLLSKINKKSESGELDYDPFLKAQDVDTASLKTFTFGKRAKKGGRIHFFLCCQSGEI